MFKAKRYAAWNTAVSPTLSITITLPPAVINDEEQDSLAHIPQLSMPQCQAPAAPAPIL